MDIKKILLGTVGYAAITFPLAYTWHLILFKSTYDELGYFTREEPIILFGFLSILIQGAILATVFPLLCRGMSFISSVGRLMVFMGVYHWTMHVLAEAAKHEIEPVGTWFLLETAYLAIQFGLGGCLLSTIYRSPSSAGETSDGNDG